MLEAFWCGSVADRLCIWRSSPFGKRTICRCGTAAATTRPAYSCSSDGGNQGLGCWLLSHCRAHRHECQISLLNGGPSHEMFSFSFGGTSGNLLAAGSSSKMLVFHVSPRASRRRSRKKHSSSSLELVQGVIKPLMFILLEQTEARTWLM